MSVKLSTSTLDVLQKTSQAALHAARAILGPS